MHCKICDSETERFGFGAVLNKYNVDFFQCRFCGFIQTEDPYWLDESYSKAINKSDVGLVRRNIDLSRISKILIVDFYNSLISIETFNDKTKLISKFFKLFLMEKQFIKILLKNKYRIGFDAKSKFLDFGSGYGLFVRLMRDYGFNFYWYDRYCENLFADGFEADMSEHYDLVTAFEVFEHMEHPIEEIEKILSFSRNILFTTELISESPPEIGSWWYYGLDHGQHISFYTKKSLCLVAEKYNLRLYSYGNTVHLLTEKKIDPWWLNFLLNKKQQVLDLIDNYLKIESLIFADYSTITGKELF